LQIGACDSNSLLPDEVKSSGFYKFAQFPPFDTSFLVTRLWDRKGDVWRDRAKEPPPLDPKNDAKIIAELKRIADAAKASDPNERLSIRDAAFMQISRSVKRYKGKWQRFPNDK
jgi:hypothetical protein